MQKAVFFSNIFTDDLHFDASITRLCWICLIICQTLGEGISWCVDGDVRIWFGLGASE